MAQTLTHSCKGILMSGIVNSSAIPPPAATEIPAPPQPRPISWHIPEVDGVRALAMLMVYIYHVWEFGDAPTRNLHLAGMNFDLYSPIARFPSGVDLFIVLSGFCLFIPLCKSSEALHKWHWKNYAIRRFRRIAPPYYAAIVYVSILPFLLTALFRLLHKQANWQPLPSLWQYVTHITFTHTLFLSTWSGICGAFWSLGLEVQFYVVFPLVVAGFRRHNLRFIFAMIGVSLIYRLFIELLMPQANTTPDPSHSDTQHFLLTVFFLGRWMQFAAGMLAAYIVARFRKNGLTRSGRDGAIAFLVVLALYALGVSDYSNSIRLFPMRDVLLAATYMILLITVCISETPLRRIFNNKIIVRLAFFSYSIFLLHQTTAYYLSELMKKILHIPGEARFYLLITVGFLLVTAISYAFFLIFEKPFLSTHLKRAEKIETA